MRTEINGNVPRREDAIQRTLVSVAVALLSILTIMVTPFGVVLAIGFLILTPLYLFSDPYPRQSPPLLYHVRTAGDYFAIGCGILFLLLPISLFALILSVSGVLVQFGMLVTGTFVFYFLILTFTNCLPRVCKWFRGVTKGGAEAAIGIALLWAFALHLKPFLQGKSDFWRDLMDHSAHLLSLPFGIYFQPVMSYYRDYTSPTEAVHYCYAMMFNCLFLGFGIAAFFNFTRSFFFEEDSNH